MTLDEKRKKLREHLEAAARLQHESWEQCSAIEALTGDHRTNIWDIVSELASAYGLAETVFPEFLLDMLLSPPPERKSNERIYIQ